jgi:uncharacterized membrane protein YccF (DUF307 family)
VSGEAPEESGLTAPSSAIEPAHALEAATGAPAGSVATAAATATFHQNIIVTQQKTGPGLLARAVWYLCIGWWLTGFAIAFAWLCSLTVVLLPVSYMIVNKIPVILTLRPRSTQTDVTVDADGTVTITTGGAKQHPFWQRALWFVCVGWWGCLVAMLAAYVLSLTIVLLPAGLMVFNRVPAVMTLQRN